MNPEARRILERSHFFPYFFHIFALVTAYFLPLFVSLILLFPIISYYAFLWSVFLFMQSYNALLVSVVFICLFHKQIEKKPIRFFIIIGLLAFFSYLTTRSVRLYFSVAALGHMAFTWGVPLAYYFLVTGVYISIARWRNRIVR